MTIALDQTPLRYGGAYDELSADGVTPRPHWAHLIDSFREMGPEEIGQRWSRAERRIRENGITYNIYGDPLGANRPWKIDVVPFLIPADEWRFIESGIIQRAELLSLILQDLYGTQRLVAEGRFPAALREPCVPAAAGRGSGSKTQLSADAGGGPCPIARRQMVGTCRPDAGSVGCRLRA